tara:strand:- start:164 stop:475 length:312 start_codon:yes stop_codon:yes gene_type:complete
MIYVKSIVANPNSKTNCLWFKASVQEVIVKHPERFNNLVSQLGNGVNSASETDVKLEHHIHIETKNFLEWRNSGADVNELTVHVTVFSDIESRCTPGSKVSAW